VTILRAAQQENANGERKQSEVHIALRVTNAETCKQWLESMLGFRIKNEFEFNSMQFVWVSPEGAESPVIEVIWGRLNQPFSGRPIGCGKVRF
jgi:hypothetical protein